MLYNNWLLVLNKGRSGNSFHSTLNNWLLEVDDGLQHELSCSYFILISRDGEHVSSTMVTQDGMVEDTLQRDEQSVAVSCNDCWVELIQNFPFKYITPLHVSILFYVNQSPSASFFAFHVL